MIQFSKLLLLCLLLLNLSCTSHIENRQQELSKEDKVLFENILIKMEKVIFPSVQLENISATEFAEFIAENSRKYCPNAEGFSVIVSDASIVDFSSEINNSRRISIDETNINLIDLLNLGMLEFETYWSLSY